MPTGMFGKHTGAGGEPLVANREADLAWICSVRCELADEWSAVPASESATGTGAKLEKLRLMVLVVLSNERSRSG